MHSKLNMLDMYLASQASSCRIFAFWLLVVVLHVKGQCTIRKNLYYI